MMRWMWCGAALAAAFGASAWAATPIEYFAAPPAVSGASISESGRYVAFQGPQPGKSSGSLITICDYQVIEKRDCIAIPFPEVDVYQTVWKGDDRLIVQIVKRDVAYDGLSKDDPRYGRKVDILRTLVIGPDGSAPVVLFQDSPRMARNASPAFIEALLPGDPDNVLISNFDGTSVALFKANVRTGVSERVERGNATNTGRGETITESWQVTPDGFAWLRQNYDFFSDTYSIEVRGRGDQRWRQAVSFQDYDEASLEYTPLALAEDGESFYAITRANGDKTALYQVPTRGGAMTQVFAHPAVDLGAGTISRSIGDFALLNEYTGALNGVRFSADAPQTHYLNANWGNAQKMLDEALPGQSPMIVGHARKFNRVLVKTGGPAAPDTYRLFDVVSAVMVPVATLYPWLDGVPLSQTRTVSYASKDGTIIKAFLTLPPGGGKDLPLVVVPHGGPEARDILEFDPLFVQALAAHGYAVIQPQFRGSAGYGEAFAAAGRKAWATTVLDDVTGAALYAEAQGIADPRRVCIYGWSFGGYAALASATFRSGFYAFAIGGAGVYDLDAMLRSEREGRRGGKAAYVYWSKQIGRLDDDAARIEASSPAKHAGEVRVPVLLVHGDADETVPPVQTKLMADALAAVGHPAEVLILKGETHHLIYTASRVQLLTAVLGFLDKHIGR